MIAKNPVVWLEGMMLHPQHFQHQTDNFKTQLQDILQMFGPYCWGFKSLEINSDFLSVGKVGIHSASGLFYDGSGFDFPKFDNIPQLIELHEGDKDLTLYLCIPLSVNGRNEIGDISDSQSIHRYTISTINRTNNVQNNNTDIDIEVAKISTIIKTCKDDLANYASIPFAKVTEVRANNEIILDDCFYPSYMTIKDSMQINKLIQEIHALLSQRAKVLSNRLSDMRHAMSSEFFDVMLLQMINKHEMQCVLLSQEQSAHPYEIFKFMVGLMSEVATFIYDQRRPPVMPRYNQSDLYGSFNPVINNLRESLTHLLEQQAVNLKLNSRNHGLWTAVINDKALFDTCNFVFAVYANSPPDVIKSIVPDQVKIAPVEKINLIVSKGLSGIPVVHLPHVPRQIPAQANYTYFSLKINPKVLEDLKSSSGISVQLSLPDPDLILELWAIKR